MALIAFIVPILPGLVWLWVFYRMDHHEPEPLSLVGYTFVLGGMAILPALGAERLATLLLPTLSGNDVWSLFLMCFFVIGPCEEVAKFLAVRLFMFRHHEFDEPLDGIVYASAAALGFASLENVIYVVQLQSGIGAIGPLGIVAIDWPTLIVRSLITLPGHVLFATAWGAALGRRKFNSRYRVWPLVGASSALHGLYDFLALTGRLRAYLLVYAAVVVPWVLYTIWALRRDSKYSEERTVYDLRAPDPEDYDRSR